MYEIKNTRLDKISQIDMATCVHHVTTRIFFEFINSNVFDNYRTENTGSQKNIFWLENLE